MHTSDNHEREVKFFLSDLQNCRRLLEHSGALLVKEQVHEINYRFDTNTNSLQNMHQLLRLRRDDQVRLTFKDQADFSSGIADRRELEIVIDDFDTALAMLEALGFSVFMIYEKYRTTYQLNQCEIVLDELPFGDFLEIEGTSIQQIRTTAETIGLNWEKRITLSYLELFNNLKANKSLQIDHILFKNFPYRNFKEADFL